MILYSGLSGKTVLCKDAVVAPDFRTFVFMDNYDSFVDPTASRYHSIIEIISTFGTPNSYSMIVQKLQTYSSSIVNSVFKKIQTSSSTYFFFHAMSTQTF